MKNLKTIIFGILLLSFNHAYSQNILQFFEMLPDSSVVGLTRAERMLIVSVGNDNKNTEDAMQDISLNGVLYAFDVVDTKNGYLRMIGAMEGHFEMCLWNLKNGNNLIAVYQESCGPECAVERFDFYSYDTSTYILLPIKTIIPDIYDDFYKIDKVQAVADMDKRDISASLLFELPRSGKNIIAKWGNSDTKETYKEYAKGNRMKLIWKDGIFEKSDIYWE